jgi:hypothetical protein
LSTVSWLQYAAGRANSTASSGRRDGERYLTYVPFALNAKRSVLGQTDELEPKKINGDFFGPKAAGTYHAVGLFDEFWRVTPGSLENVVERRAQVFVVLSRLIVQELLWGRV